MKHFLFFLPISMYNFFIWQVMFPHLQTMMVVSSFLNWEVSGFWNWNFEVKFFLYSFFTCHLTKLKLFKNISPSVYIIKILHFASYILIHKIQKIKMRHWGKIRANGFKENQWEPNQIVILIFLIFLLLFIKFQCALNDHQVRYAHTIFLALGLKCLNA